ncbi:hypothetical protein AB0M92_32445 [Streptomyces sp. NPDC051582]|uniref:hypothetical protein n=1 Tax=Streptomyces sp. NPDC051582 TaxID=3155167 RepID=UPI00341F6362
MTLPATAPKSSALRCFVYARTPGTPGTPGTPWLLGVVPGDSPQLPHAVLSHGADPADTADAADAAAEAVRRLTGRTPLPVTPPVPPLESAGPAAAWWLRAPHRGPYETEYEYVMTLPGPPPAGLAWLDPALAGLHDPHDENLRLAAALGAVMDALLAGRITPEVIRAMTLGHSRRSVGRPRAVPLW